MMEYVKRGFDDIERQMERDTFQRMECPLGELKRALIKEEYAEYNQELVDIKIEQQLERNTEDSFNHIISIKNELIKEDFKQQPDDIKIEQQLEAKTENPFNHTLHIGNSEPNVNIIDATDLKSIVNIKNDSNLTLQIADSKKANNQKDYYDCRICHQTFKHEPHLDRHEWTHMGEELFKCSVCNKTFDTIVQLTNHKMMHTTEKRFKCRICNQAFRLKTSLYGHNWKKHSTNRPYRCEVCDQCFKQKSHLDSHKSIHTDDNLTEFKSS